MSDHGRLFQDTYLDLNREEQKEFEASVNNSRKKEEDYRRGGRVTVRSYRRAARVSAPYVLLNSRVSPAGAIEPRPKYHLEKHSPAQTKLLCTSGLGQSPIVNPFI